ncbi:tRNA (adenosine(37)-N6)-threonylcarbamoyltransferase complex transferase subunit TsaD [Geobacter pelophilus]|jgi:N6-L-threonylcarbamoyladenine synthase|uniref:tRNA N6-adenosine threonylcarbamoyltransferase n=1 Tax=Geoanaerobacter pelophilus TaxID=60036 RepID=A0AAW4LBD6_9BACT|nr:tRNA (adenosine(37)-N6)-threonylcarbamoyltransferase complex transferase subunit TsaD [Geoanaerobacter pelophilus]MBT0665706.1 tRNA (adenosine(37)-N6)-threonylcarbamoyltransferase complex transferase subunit TsaD [Geoanaerobacter pelophilus]
MLVLAIESSCDETAAAVVRDGRTVLSSIVASQVAIHAEYGGVVPEIASRRHLESVAPVVIEALKTAGVTLDEIKGIAVTQGPGLVGALLVGIAAARGIAAACSIPVTGVNHIEAHLLAPFLEQEIAFPYLALVVSGGHTHLYKVDGIGHYTILGQTLDDAAGEAFDKVAKLVGLPYPGGALIDRLAAEGDPVAVKLPRPLLHDGSCNFSFSGLKTAVLNWTQKNPEGKSGQLLNDLCASFQAAVCEVLTVKTWSALEKTGITRLVIAGGVACNSGLRREMSRLAATRGIDLYIPSPALCADNAAMVAVPGEFYLSRRIATINGFDALPSWPLDRIKARFAEAT